MRKLSFCKVFLLLFVLIAVYVYTRVTKINNNDTNIVITNSAISQDVKLTDAAERKIFEKIFISFVVCDSRFKESLNVIKSVLLFSDRNVHFIIFTDDNLKEKFNETLSRWSGITNKQLSFELHKINFPKEHEEDWMNLFSKCAAQRLFIPSLLPEIDALIYVDTDTLFLGPVEELWEFFSEFNNTQISAMALEDDNPNISWYPRFAKHPFYGKYGLNSGVMLMNLTRMRDAGWVDYVTPIMLKWKLNIPWGDQDIINIIFHYHERAVYVLSCRYNYRSDQCMYGDACTDATSNGVFLLHGSRGAFHNDKQPAFKAIYNAIDEYNIEMSASSTLRASIEKYFATAEPSNCANLKEAFLKVPYKTLQLYNEPDR